MGLDDLIKNAMTSRRQEIRVSHNFDYANFLKYVRWYI